MYKIYFKQAIQLLKQNPFISTITIVGTALAIMMIMVLIVSESIKNTSIAPESNRYRMMYMKFQNKKHKKEDMSESGSIPYDSYKNYISQIKTPEFTSAQSIDWESEKLVSAAGENADASLQKIKMVDANFWKIMSYSFIEGKPFTQEDFDSGLKKAVITDKVARKVFGTNDAIGKTLIVDLNAYTVVGVMKEVSSVFTYACADVFIPYTSKTGYDKMHYNILIMAKSPDDFDAIREEMRDQERKYKAQDADWNIDFWGPFDQKVQRLQVSSNEPPNEKRSSRKMLFIFLILLIVPAVNLSSFSMSRMSQRIEEIGIRKAFGATKMTILNQVLYESLITSLIGGFIGLILSYGIVIWLKNWLLDVSSSDTTYIPIEAFVTLPVFVGVFFVCVLLNLLSAGIPAYKASKVKIVDSLNHNK